MKKILTIAFICLTSALVANCDSTNKKCNLQPYASIGVSVTNSNDFKYSSYPSIELGVMRKNMSYGLVIGRGSLLGICKPNDMIENYYFEAKTGAYFPIGEVTGSLIFGYGEFFNTRNNFIEYGVGASITQGKMGYGITYSNWNGVNYLTPAITINF